MRLAIISTAFAFTIASAHPYAKRQDVGTFQPAGPNDARGPCPMMNTLANHGFLPRDGGGITKEVAVSALTTAINFDTALAELMFQMATIANPEPNATFFTLDHLNRHNVLEHDASLSRTDAFFGNNHVFNQTVFDETRQFWTGPVLDANMLANGKIARQVASKAFNPTYTFTETMEQFSLGEVAAPIIVFGDMQSVTVNRTFVEFFFANEKLPSELGWVKQAEVVRLEDIGRMTQLIANATSLITVGEPVISSRGLRDLHSGLDL